jgi:hypothetical protein
MVQPKDVDPVSDMSQFTSLPMAPAWKKVIERFCPVLELLNCPLHDLPQPRAMEIDVML